MSVKYWRTSDGSLDGIVDPIGGVEHSYLEKVKLAYKKCGGDNSAFPACHYAVPVSFRFAFKFPPQVAASQANRAELAPILRTCVAHILQTDLEFVSLTPVPNKELFEVKVTTPSADENRTLVGTIKKLAENNGLLCPSAALHLQSKFPSLKLTLAFTKTMDANTLQRQLHHLYVSAEHISMPKPLHRPLSLLQKPFVAYLLFDEGVRLTREKKRADKDALADPNSTIRTLFSPYGLDDAKSKGAEMWLGDSTMKVAADTISSALGHAYGPSDCAFIGQGNDGKCRITTQECDPVALATHENSFLCVKNGTGPEVHSFGRFDMGPSEVFETDVECHRCEAIPELQNGGKRMPLSVANSTEAAIYASSKTAGAIVTHPAALVGVLLFAFV